jgi:hypothetical protein
MKRNKHLPVLGAAAAAAAVILLFLILWLPPSPQPEPVERHPGARRGEVTYAPADALLPAGSPQPGDKAAVHRFGVPNEWFVAGAMGETYPDTLSGEGFRAGEADVYLGQSPPDGPYLPHYVVGRAYPGWDTSLLPDDAEVVSATLVLELPASGGREESLEIVIYRGMWNPPIDLGDWRLPASHEMGRWQLPPSRVEERQSVDAGQDLALYAPEPARTMRVTLDPTIIRTTGVTRLELRHAQEGSLPSTASVVLLGRAMISLEVEYRP